VKGWSLSKSHKRISVLTLRQRRDSDNAPDRISMYNMHRPELLQVCNVPPLAWRFVIQPSVVGNAPYVLPNPALPSKPQYAKNSRHHSTIAVGRSVWPAFGVTFLAHTRERSFLRNCSLIGRTEAPRALLRRFVVLLPMSFPSYVTTYSVLLTPHSRFETSEAPSLHEVLIGVLP
jgi:hypothetical protein